jgi:hypothetical protein
VGDATGSAVGVGGGVTKTGGGGVGVAGAGLTTGSAAGTRSVGAGGAASGAALSPQPVSPPNSKTNKSDSNNFMWVLSQTAPLLENGRRWHWTIPGKFLIVASIMRYTQRSKEHP